MRIEGLDRFFDQHKSRRALTGAPSQFHDAAQRDFYVRLIRALAPTGWLRFDVVLFDDAPIAFHLGFEHRGRFLWYKPTFDARLAAKSPGEVLIKLLLDDAIDRGLKEFDFTVGAEPFKLRFANDRVHEERSNAAGIRVARIDHHSLATPHCQDGVSYILNVRR